MSIPRRFCLLFAAPAMLLLGGGTLLAARPNVLLICVDDLRPELRCFGKSYIDSPNIDRLAEAGVRFTRHYVQAPTCGASRYTLLTGTYGPSNNQALFSRARRMAENPDSVSPSLPGWLRTQGYRAVSVGKVSHHPGGRGGEDWDDPEQIEMPGAWDRHLMPTGPWDHPRGAMHGLAHGEIRKQAGQMDVFQSVAGEDSIYPDGLILDTARDQLDQLTAAGQPPFLLAVGFIRPHLPFGAPANYMDPYRDLSLPPIPHPEKPSERTTWHRSGEFMKYNRWGKDPNRDEAFASEVRRHYAACVSYADACVGQLLAHLKQCGADDNTIVVLWGDHGWNLGEHAIWGKHCLFEESLRSPLIIRAAGQQRVGARCDAIVESIDLFPTLCELADLPTPAGLDGRSLVPQLNQPERAGRPAIAYTGRAKTVRSDRYRLVLHRDGFVELYDHQKADAETENLATGDQPPQQVIERLTAALRRRLAD